MAEHYGMGANDISMSSTVMPNPTGILNQESSLSVAVRGTNTPVRKYFKFDGFDDKWSNWFGSKKANFDITKDITCEKVLDIFRKLNFELKSQGLPPEYPCEKMFDGNDDGKPVDEFGRYREVVVTFEFPRYSNNGRRLANADYITFIFGRNEDGSCGCRVDTIRKAPKLEGRDVSYTPTDRTDLILDGYTDRRTNTGVSDMNLFISSANIIDVTEDTPNIGEIQSFSVVSRRPDGVHLHRDPNTGQLYRMTQEMHRKIPEILASRNRPPSNSPEQLTQLINISSDSMTGTDAGSMIGLMLQNFSSENIDLFSQSTDNGSGVSFEPIRTRDYSVEDYSTTISSEKPLVLPFNGSVSNNSFNYGNNNQNFNNSIVPNTAQNTYLTVNQNFNNSIVPNTAQNTYLTANQNFNRRAMNRVPLISDQSSNVILTNSTLKNRPMNTIRSLSNSSFTNQPSYSLRNFKIPMNSIGKF